MYDIQGVDNSSVHQVFTEPGMGYGLIKPTLQFLYDDASPVTLTYSPPRASNFPIGDTLLTVSLIDDDGNPTTKQVTIRVVDNESPSHDGCPADIVRQIPAGANQNFMAFASSEFVPTGISDNSGIPPTIQSNAQASYSLTNTPASVAVRDMAHFPPVCNCILRFLSWILLETLHFATPR